jgi:MFS family permease
LGFPGPSWNKWCERLFETLKAYPRAFKVLVASALIENMAFGLIIPYLTIYMTEEIKISDALAGVVLMGYMLSGIPSMIFGGMLVDKIGRRVVLLTSLGLMAITVFSYSFASDFLTLMIIALADSFVGSLYMPAASAMIADVIPSERRPQAYSTQRIAWNVGLIFGPAVGAALVTTQSLKILFLFGALILAGAFIMNFLFIPETKPENTGEEVTFRKVAAVSRNRPFFLICAMSGIFWACSTQFMSVLPVFVTRDLNLAEWMPGALWVINGGMIVALQLWVTSKAVKFRRSVVMAVGQTISATGLGLIFFAVNLPMLAAFVVVMTVGELIYMSVLAAVIADMAPEEQRGVYMGFAGFLQTLGMGIGMLAGMFLLGNLGHNSAFVWVFFGAVGISTSSAYLVFGRMIGPEKDHPARFGFSATPTMKSH